MAFTKYNRPTMIRAIALLLCVLSGSRANNPNYCEPKLCNGEKHIACGHDGSFSSECPADAKLLEVDARAQLSTVAAHNAVRQQWASGQGKVQVKACRMATIAWDAELASLAELNVKQCVMEHDDCHNTQKYHNSGQNLFIAGYSGMGAPDVPKLLSQAVEDWAQEGNDITAQYLESYPEDNDIPVIGHFTAVVQERNVAVGCAIANYLKDGYNTFLVACNYAVTNFIGRPVYTACSTAAEGCKSGTNPDYSALCSSSEDVDYNNV